MTEKQLYNLSRRKVLGGLGAIGLASAGAGFGTSAYFNDVENFDGNVLTAGSLDLLVDYYSYWDQGMRGVGSVNGTADGPTVTAVLDDMKPGDSGLLAFCFEVVDNPAYMWACGELVANDENSVTEPEAGDDPNNTSPAPNADIDGDGELAQSIEVLVRYCDVADDLTVNGDSGFDPADITATYSTIFDGTLAEFLAAIRAGVPLDGTAASGLVMPGSQAPYDGTTNSTGNTDVMNPCVCIEWEIPTSVTNEIQSDSLEFDMSFYAEQARHNDGTHNPCLDAVVNEGWGDAGFDPAFFGRVRHGKGGWEMAVGNGNSPGTDDNADYNWPASTFDGSFDLVYDAANDVATLTLYDGAGTAVQSVAYGDDGSESLADADGNNIGITVAADGTDAPVARVENVTYDGGSATVDSVESTGTTMSLVLSGMDTSVGFTLAGDIYFEGLGSAASQERPSMTVHVE